MFVSYAQNFEDAMLWRALRHLPSGFYVDVGAQDPVVDSVSKAFYDAGWRGAHVEPVAEYAELLRKARPDEQVFQVALGVKAGTQKFFVVPSTGLSTSIRSIADRHRKERKYEVTEIRVPCLTLDQVFEATNHTEIQWLKIDVEGAEREVLSGWDGKRFRPWIVVVESTLPNSTIENFEQWEHLVLGADYQLVYQDGLNRFYVSAERAAELASSFKTPPNVFDEIASSGKGGYWGAYLNATFAEDERTQQAKFQAEIAALAERERSQLAKAQEEINSLAGRLLQSDHTRVVIESTLDGRLAESKLQVDTVSANLVASERQLELAGALHKAADERASLVERQLAMKDQEVEQSLAEARQKLGSELTQLREKLGVAVSSAQTEAQARSQLAAQYAIQCERLDAAENLSAAHQRNLLKREAAVTVLDEKVAELTATERRYAESHEKLAVELSSKSEQLASTTRLSEILETKLANRDLEAVELTRLLLTAQQAAVRGNAEYESRLTDLAKAQEKLSLELSGKSEKLASTTRLSEILETKLANRDLEVVELTRLLHAAQQAAVKGSAEYESRLAASAKALDRLHDKWEAESRRMQQLIADLETQRENIKRRYEEHVASARSQAQTFENARQGWVSTIADCQALHGAVLRNRDQILASKSWKLTAPLRRIGRVFAKSSAEK